MSKKTGLPSKRDEGSQHRLTSSSVHVESASSTGPVRDEMRVSLLGAVLLFGPLTLLGQWLIQHTHHRPLGAATFASCTILAWMAVEVVTRILFSGRRLRPAEVQRTKRWLVGIGLLTSLFVFARAFI